MLNPKVGLTVETSSPLKRLTIVVLPALSNPLENVPREGQRANRTKKNKK